MDDPSPRGAKKRKGKNPKCSILGPLLAKTGESYSPSYISLHGLPKAGEKHNRSFKVGSSVHESLGTAQQKAVPNTINLGQSSLGTAGQHAPSLNTSAPLPAGAQVQEIPSTEPIDLECTHRGTEIDNDSPTEVQWQSSSDMGGQQPHSPLILGSHGTLSLGARSMGDQHPQSSGHEPLSLGGRSMVDQHPQSLWSSLSPHHEPQSPGGSSKGDQQPQSSLSPNQESLSLGDRSNESACNYPQYFQALQKIKLECGVTRNFGSHGGIVDETASDSESDLSRDGTAGYVSDPDGTGDDIGRPSHALVAPGETLVSESPLSGDHVQDIEHVYQNDTVADGASADCRDLVNEDESGNGNPGETVDADDVSGVQCGTNDEAIEDVKCFPMKVAEVDPQQPTTVTIAPVSRHTKYCNECGEPFTQLKKLRRHMAREHKMMQYKCSVCNRGFCDSYLLRDHLKIHTGELPHVCNLCGKSFRALHMLRGHAWVHGEPKPHKCPFCWKSFTSKSSLKEHNLVHVGRGPHQCSACRMSFVSKARLKKHMRSHTGEKPFKCSVCNKEFGQAGNFYRHLKIHSGELSFQCPICKKTFSDQYYLRNHIRIHNGEKPFACPVCDCTFVLGCHLKRHMVIHTGEKAFVCNVCGESFCYTSTLKTHYKKHSKAERRRASQVGGILHETTASGNTEGQGDPTGTTLPTPEADAEDEEESESEEEPRVKKYNCQLCGNAFSYSYTLKRHIKRGVCKGRPTVTTNDDSNMDATLPAEGQSAALQSRANEVAEPNLDDKDPNQDTRSLYDKPNMHGSDPKHDASSLHANPARDVGPVYGSMGTEEYVEGASNPVKGTSDRCLDPASLYDNMVDKDSLQSASKPAAREGDPSSDAYSSYNGNGHLINSPTNPPAPSVGDHSSPTPSRSEGGKSSKYHCPQCHKLLATKSTLTRHKKTCRGFTVDELMLSEEKTFSCSDCGKIMGSRRTLRKHKLKYCKAVQNVLDG